MRLFPFQLNAFFGYNVWHICDSLHVRITVILNHYIPTYCLFRQIIHISVKTEIHWVLHVKFYETWEKLMIKVLWNISTCFCVPAKLRFGTEYQSGHILWIMPFAQKWKFGLNVFYSRQTSSICIQLYLYSSRANKVSRDTKSVCIS